MEWFLGILLAALTVLATAWLKAFLNPIVPSPTRVRLALKNLCQGKPERSEDRFRIVPVEPPRLSRRLRLLRADHDTPVALSRRQ